MQREYHIEIKVRNNWLLKKMLAAGYDSVAQFAREAKINRQSIDRYLNLTAVPFGKDGWKTDIIKISAALGCIPEELIPPKHLEKALAKNRANFEASSDEVAAYLSGTQEATLTPIDSVISEENEADIRNVLTKLTPREERVLRLRFGFVDGTEQTLETVGDKINVTRARIRQIEAKALRKLKHPSHSKQLRIVADSMGIGDDNRCSKAVNRHYVPEWKRKEAAE